MSFNFIAAVTICSDFEAQENKICHCFYFFPFYLHEVEDGMPPNTVAYLRTPEHRFKWTSVPAVQGPSYSVALRAGPGVGRGQAESWAVLWYQREHIKSMH